MKRVTAEQKRLVRKRAYNQCEYCRTLMDYAPEVFSIDHVIPQSRGGESTLDNLALSCQACNNHKYTRVTWVDPLSGEMAPLYNPRQQLWKDHFTWSKDFTLIVGRTPTGWATIEALDMN
ncbi:MAG TPA: HNH endonuclease [Chloroflexia bacterium]|nr:HNH endonuclease [Chloroflexia bacterium]